MKRLALLCLIAPALVVTAAPAQADSFNCSQVTHRTDAYKWMGGDSGGDTKYDWSLRIKTQHCSSPTSYFDDIVELRVRGEIDAGTTNVCQGQVALGWKTYTADVGRLGAKDPDLTSWECGEQSWQMTWDYPSNDNLYVGAGDRCVGAHVRWVRPFADDASDDIPQVCF